MGTNRSGFTLMELLLVVAILAVVAAVAAPQFFRSSTVAMTDARVMLLKANYSAVKASINMALWDDMNNPNLTAAQKLSGAASYHSVKEPTSLIRRLVDRGFLQEPACFFENEAGQKLYLCVVLIGTTVANPYSTVASAPIFMEQTNRYHVGVRQNDSAMVADIDELLRSGLNTSWEQVWNTVKAAPGL